MSETTNQTATISTPEQPNLGTSAPSPAPSTVSSAKETLKNPTAPVEAKREAQKLLKKYDIKVDGASRTIELDINNDSDVIKHLQMSAASQKRMQESAEVRKAAMDFIDQLRKNPRKVLTDPNIGVDVKKFAEEILNEQLQEAEKSPEQREREKLQAELQEARKRAKDLEEENKNKDFSRMQAEQANKLESDISAALDVGGLPKTPRTVKNMAEYMMIALQNGIDLSAQDIAPIVKNNTKGEFMEILSSLSDDQLEDFLGKTVIGRLRKKNVSKAKLQTASAIKDTATAAAAKKDAETPKKKMTIKELLGV